MGRAKPVESVHEPIQHEVASEPVAQAAIAPAAPATIPPVVWPVKKITAAFEDTWLPSNFLPYDWSDIQIRRLNIEELRAIVRARVSGNLRHLVRAVDATISRHAHELTVGDFWYLMYWHRLNSYKKSPFIIDWTCTDVQHQHSVNVGDQVLVSDQELEAMDDAEKLALIKTPELDDDGEETGEIDYYRLVKRDPQSLRNLLQVSGSNLETDEIDSDAYLAVRQQIETEYGVDIVPQRLVDLIDSLEEQETKRAVRKAKEAKAKAAEAEGNATSIIDQLEDEMAEEDIVEDEEQAFMHRYAALLSPIYGVKLDDRAEYLNSMDPDLLVDLERFLEVSEHGVRESWKVQCKGCGAKRTVEQSLDALTFLPSLQRGGLA